MQDEIMQDKTGPIDWQKVLQIANKKPKLAKEMITMLSSELPEMKTQINALYASKSYTKLLDLIHKLHGSCCYCGVAKLKKLTAKIEINLKKNEYEDLASDIPTLSEEIDLIVQYVNDKVIT